MPGSCLGVTVLLLLGRGQILHALEVAVIARDTVILVDPQLDLVRCHAGGSVLLSDVDHWHLLAVHCSKDMRCYLQCIKGVTMLSTGSRSSASTEMDNNALH